MDEIRTDNLLEIKLQDGSVLKGRVKKYAPDRLLVLIEDSCLEIAKKLKELDDVYVTAYTRYGIREMTSGVISPLDSKKHIIIENNEAKNVDNSRETVRAVDEFSFVVSDNKKIYTATAKNISAGGAAFDAPEADFKIGQIIRLSFGEKEFSKFVHCKAEVVLVKNRSYAVRFVNMSSINETLIVKRIYKLLSIK